jgi:hypothetical protein
VFTDVSEELAVFVFRVCVVGRGLAGFLITVEPEAPSADVCS